MHICVSKQTIIGSDNGLSPGWRQAIIWTNAGILLIAQTQDIFTLVDAAWKHPKYPCFCILPLEFEDIEIYTWKQ